MPTRGTLLVPIVGVVAVLLHSAPVTVGLTLMVAPYEVVGDSFHADKPQPWSPTSIRGPRVGNAAYDLHPDGKRVAGLAAVNQGGTGTDKVVFVSNFFDYLRKIAPRTKR